MVGVTTLRINESADLTWASTRRKTLSREMSVLQKKVIVELSREIPVLLTSNPPTMNRSLPRNLASFPSMEGVSQEGIEVQYIIIDSECNEDLLKVLKSIRQHPKFYYKLVMTNTLSDKIDQDLIDGKWTTEIDGKTRAETINSRRKHLMIGPLENDPESRFLHFLYTRPKQILEPRIDYTQTCLYRYPLLELFDVCSRADQFMYINGLLNRGFLRKQKLFNKVRVCAKCLDGHVNYVDECPHCASLNIEKREFFHCFPCGHVAPESKFLIESKLLCPQCNTLLTRYGVDYDRSMEAIYCLDCGGHDSEAHVVARCFHCNQSSDPADLKLKKIFSFDLSDQGKLYLLNKQRNSMYVPGTKENYFEVHQFKAILDWLINAYVHVQKLSFTLILVHIDDRVNQLQNGEYSRFCLLLEEFASNLYKRMGKAGMTTRISNTDFLILNLAHKRRLIESFLANIQNTIQQTKFNSNINITLDCFKFPDEWDSHETGEIMISRLTSGVEKNKRFASRS